MAGPLPPAGRLGALLTRVAARLTTPFAYLAVLGGLQIVVIWTTRIRYPAWLVLLTALAWLTLLLALALRPGHWRLKLGGACLLGVLSAFVPVIAAIAYRARAGLTTEHDGLLQLESAVSRLLNGQPIYGVDWSNTPMAAYHWDLTPGGNPALHHLAYFPLAVLVGVPFRLLTDALGTGFDYRLVLLSFAVLGLLSILALPVGLDRRFMLVCAVFCSPLVTLYLWPGRNDIEFLAVILLAIAVLVRGRLLVAAAVLGAAVALKPFAWPAIPFLLLVLFARWRQDRDTRALLMSSLALAVIPVTTIVPFLVANPRGFWTDTVLYASGGIPDAYPVAGYGFGALLYATGLIRHRTDGFPFVLFQLAVMAPVLLVGARAFLRRPTIGRWMGGYACLLFVFMFFARFFNDNYAAVVITLLLCVRPVGDRLLIPARGRPAEQLAA